MLNVHGMDFDIVTNTVYWCEPNEGNIYRANIDSDGRELIHSGLGAPEEVAVNWINRKLYWSDSHSKTIEFSNLDGSNRTVFLRNIVNQPPSFEIDQPRALAIDPLSGHFYWADWGKTSKIEKMTLIGRNRHVIISNLGWPTGLTIDYATSVLYWVDGLHEHVGMSDLEGRTIRYIYQDGPVSYPFGIAVYQSMIYLTDWTKRSVTSGNADGSTTLRNITFGIKPSDIHVVHHLRQPGACK